MNPNNYFIGNFEINDSHLQSLGEISQIHQQIMKLVNDRQVFYMYDQAESIIRDEIYPRFRDADKDMSNRGRIFFLYGDYNTGKSYLVRYAASLLFRKFSHYWHSPDIYPIRIIDLRDDINTAKQLMLYLLAHLGFPIDPILLKNWERAHVAEVRLREKLITLLESHQTRILVLDECQRLLKARNPNIPNIFEFIKDLTTKSYWSGPLRTSIIFCGTHDGLPLLDAADWIQGRAHSIKMRELRLDEYAYFLWTIYTDFMSLGISNDWNLAIYDKKTKDRVLNPEIASFLFQRTRGKVGLTVEIIRDAVKRALNRGQLHPSQNDYKLVILEGIDYDDIELSSQKQEKVGNEKRIPVGIKDRLCKVNGCTRSRNPYAHYNSLIRHYKLKHPNVQIINRAGERM